ncbi:MAG: phenylalanine--tRNA ligase subunit alpha [Desulfomonilaceae bacterium]|jgi:phenylalanyl-tRNA synthetase alpha chain
MKDQLDSLRASTVELLAYTMDPTALNEARTKILGRKGELTSILRGLKNLPVEERSVVGQLANQIKSELEVLFETRESDLRDALERDMLALETIDVTLSGRRLPLGKSHILNRVTQELVEVFSGLGFQLAEGPEVEIDYYNFEALNMPKNHPARDMQDTFYFSENVLLRTHTSPVQIRTMEKRKPPVKVICPGKVYRRDADVTHSPMFMQVEGLWVDERVSFSDLKGVLTAFAREYFGDRLGLRFRPSFFPFTEPSAEVDIQCVICGGSGCRTCSFTGWLEILGSGMVDPALYKFVGYDPEIYSGFAFGLGVERVAMLKYGIPDIRLFYENDVRFLGQF